MFNRIRNYNLNIMAEGRRNPRRNDDRDTKISKTLSYLLRHGAKKHGLTLSSDGFALVEDVLKIEQLHGCTEEDIKRVVDTNDKKRFTLTKDPNSGKSKVCANQGHTIEVPDLQLTEIQNGQEYPVVIHGTSMKAWKQISLKGLSRMDRTHIHFACGEPGNGEVISGMRPNCEVLIFVDLQKALTDGVKFYVSANKVILSSGDANGILKPKYFDKVLERTTRKSLLTNSSTQ